MPYLIYHSDDTSHSHPITISTDTVDTTSTSITLIGQDWVGYGQYQNQNFLSILENFSNSTSPANPTRGQLWYDETNLELKVFNNALWNVVGSPPSQASGPTGAVTGNLWWDNVGNVLKEWTGSSWVVIGPSQTNAPISVYEQDYSTGTTTNAVVTELFKGGVSGSRLVIPSNTTWVFDTQIAARRTDSGTEFGGWRIRGVINNTGGVVTFAGTPPIETYGATSAWTVSVTADNINQSLGIFVVGQGGKTIDWTAVTTLVKAT
jgi:hypothetical protein